VAPGCSIVVGAWLRFVPAKCYRFVGLGGGDEPVGSSLGVRSTRGVYFDRWSRATPSSFFTDGSIDADFRGLGDSHRAHGDFDNIPFQTERLRTHDQKILVIRGTDRCEGTPGVKHRHPLTAGETSDRAPCVVVIKLDVDSLIVERFGIIVVVRPDYAFARIEPGAGLRFEVVTECGDRDHAAFVGELQRTKGRTTIALHKSVKVTGSIGRGRRWTGSRWPRIIHIAPLPMIIINGRLRCIPVRVGGATELTGGDIKLNHRASAKERGLVLRQELRSDVVIGYRAFVTSGLRKLPPLTHSSRLLQALRPYEHTPNQVPIASDRTLAHGKVCSGDGDSKVTQLARCVIMSEPDARGMHRQTERNRRWSSGWGGLGGRDEAVRFCLGVWSTR